MNSSETPSSQLLVADTPTTTVDTVAIIEEKKDILAPVITAAVTTAPVSPKETTNDKGVKRKTMASSESDDVDVDASMGVSKKSKKDDEDSTLEKLIAEKIKITMAAFEAKRKTEMAEKKKRAIEDAKKKRPLLPVQTIQTVQPVQPIQPVQIAQATPSISSIKPLVTVTDKEKTKDEEVKTEKKKEESKKKKEKKKQESEDDEEEEEEESASDSEEDDDKKPSKKYSKIFKKLSDKELNQARASLNKEMTARRKRKIRNVKSTLSVGDRVSWKHTASGETITGLLESIRGTKNAKVSVKNKDNGKIVDWKVSIPLLTKVVA
jgi:hypothetical protein